MAEAKGGLAASEVLARVNGQEIRQGDLDLRLEEAAPAELEWLEKGRLTLEELLEHQIDSEIAAEAHVAGAHDQTPESRSLQESLERRLLRDAYFTGTARRTWPTPERLQQAYAAWLKDHPPKQSAWFDFILVAEKSAAEDLLAGLKKGAGFRELRDRHCVAHRAVPGAEEEGQKPLYWPRPALRRVVHAAVVQEIFALSVGRSSRRPVKAGKSWVLIHLHDRLSEDPPSLEALRDRLSEEIVFKDRFLIAAEARKQVRIELLLPEFPDEMPDHHRVVALVEGRPLTLWEAGGKELSWAMTKLDPARHFKPDYPSCLERAVGEAALAEAGRRAGLDRDPDSQFRLRYKLRRLFSRQEHIRRAVEMAKAGGEEDLSNPVAISVRLGPAVEAELRASALVERIGEPRRSLA